MPLLLLGAVAALAVLCLLSLVIGSRQIPPGDALAALLDPRGNEVEAVVNGLRVPRTLLGLLAGVALGLSGAIMQGLTRNPLADPGLLGISAGAAFAIVLAAGVFGVTSLHGHVWVAFAGALTASVLVYRLGSLGRGGATPVKLAVAGIAMTFLLASLSSAVLLTNRAVINSHRFWAAGSLTGRDAALVVQVLPFLLVGVALALSCARGLNSVALGDDIAGALGWQVGLLRLRCAVAVMLLTGVAVAVAGPIVFVGLVIPHVARLITGPDHRWLLPYAMVLAPCLLLAADILGRVIARPAEVGAGVMVAFLGAPFFLALIRRRRLAEL